MRNLIYIALVTFCVACADANRSNHEEAVLDQERFTALLLDVRLLEASYATHYARVDSAQALSGYYLKLFEKHQTTKDQFMRSYDHYASKQSELKVIEDSVVARLSRMNK